MTYDMSTATAATDQAPARPESGGGRNQWAFHLIAAVVCVGAALAAGFAAVVLSFGTSVCNESDTSQELVELRIGLAVIGGVLTMVPTFFAVAAAKLRFVWMPWAALAGVAALATIGLVATAEVSTWCMF